MTPHLPKTHPVKDPLLLGEFARTHWYCQACGADFRPLQNHHIIGGRGGRSDDPCNLLRVCFHPCHDLAGPLDVVHLIDDRRSKHEFIGLAEVPDAGKPSLRRFLLPKITLSVAIAMKIRAGEWGDAELARMTVLNAMRPIEPVAIPEWFLAQFERNRPEVMTTSPRAVYVHRWSRERIAQHLRNSLEEVRDGS